MREFGGIEITEDFVDEWPEGERRLRSALQVLERFAK